MTTRDPFDESTELNEFMDHLRAESDDDSPDPKAKRVTGHWLAGALRRLADEPRSLFAAHLALEDQLIQMRDAGLSVVNMHGGPANGLVVRYKDGSPSDIIRIPIRDAVYSALIAIADDLELQADGKSPRGID